MSDQHRGSSLLDRPGLHRFYDGRRVVVAGGDGFLGRNCVDALVALDAKVSIVTRQTHAESSDLDQIFVGDLREAALAREAVSGASVVFDFAGSSGAVDSNARPDAHLLRDCGAKLNLFRACAEASASAKVLFCSSRLVYGQPLYVPVDDTHPLRPQSFYAAHKIAAESYLKVFGQTHQLRSTVLRVSNPYGPHQGDRPRSYGVINQFLQRAARRQSIRVYGHGHQVRDYIHARDLVGVFLACGATGRSDGETINVGGREAVRLKDAAELITRIAGAPPVELVPWPADYERVETGDYITDLTKLESILGPSSQVSLEEGFGSSIEAYREATGAAVASEAMAGGGTRAATAGV